MLHVPKAAHLHCEASMHHNGLDHGAEGVRLHVHAWLLAGQVRLHYGVALGHHVFPVERLGALVGVAVHADVLQPARRVVARPEEVLSLLVGREFLRGI